MGVGGHYGIFLKPLLLIIVLDVLITEFRTGCRCELLDTEDVMSSDVSLEELLVTLVSYGSQRNRSACTYMYT